MDNMELENSMTDIAPAAGYTGNGVPYYDNLMQSEQMEVTEIIRLLWRQTFILEHKYDKRTGRFQYNRDYRVCSKHLEFMKNYFAISGVELRENSQMGVMYIQGETVVGDKLPRLATLYLLVLKLIYDEQMESVSTSVNVYTSLREIHAVQEAARSHGYPPGSDPPEKIPGHRTFGPAGGLKKRKPHDYISLHQRGAHGRRCALPSFLL